MMSIRGIVTAVIHQHKSRQHSVRLYPVFLIVCFQIGIIDTILHFRSFSLMGRPEQVIIGDFGNGI